MSRFANKYEHVRALSKRGCSVFEMARLAGCSEFYVRQVLSGAAAERTTKIRPGSIARCPECGGRVQMPCTLCKLKKLPRVRPASIGGNA